MAFPHSLIFPGQFVGMVLWRKFTCSAKDIDHCFETFIFKSAFQAAFQCFGE